MKHSLRSAFCFLILALAVLPGCRREDVREMTVSMPGLKESDKATVVAALAKYGGVQKDSYKWDMEAKTLTLRYDSMQVAQANIRYAIDEKGVKVAFPALKNGQKGGRGPAKISTFALHVYEVMEKKGMTMQQAVDAFKAVGVTGFDGEYTDPKLDDLAAAGLKPAMIYGVMSFRDPSKDEVEQNKYLERAKKLGAKYMMIVPDMMGDLKDDPSDPVYEREFLKTIDGLKRLVAKCKAAGICPLVEDFGYRTNPGSHFCNLKRYFAEIPDLYFALDTGNVMFSDRGTDILEEFEYFHDKIRHVHVKDHPKGGPQAFAMPGEGVVPNEKMLRQLFSEGYDGWVTLELFDAPDMMEAVTKTCAFINGCR